jgi:hypothetical protein
MLSSSQSRPQLAAAANMLPAQPDWSTGPDDVAFGCECADPALQIACWGQEAGEAIAVASS